ncbi:MAG: SMC family ATPase, partial [Bacteroidota bacterium]
MILKQLHLKNFKQYSALELDFQEGLVGIVGRNGSGKSSIFEAVLLCLFGSNNTDKEFYKSSWAGPKDPVELSLSFELNQKHHMVVRSFRGRAMTHKAELFDHEDKLIATGASPVNQQVSEILGMDKEAFTRSVFSGQKELGIISGTRGEERKKMVRKMVGLDHLDQIQKIIREDRNTV